MNEFTLKKNDTMLGKSNGKLIQDGKRHTRIACNEFQSGMPVENLRFNKRT